MSFGGGRRFGGGNGRVNSPRGVVGAGFPNGQFGRGCSTNVASTTFNNASAVNSFYGPDTADRTTALAGLTAQQRFVQVLYLNVLGRVGTLSELNSWLPALNGANGQQVVAENIEGSLEGRTRLVKTWYQTYLGRGASPLDAQLWPTQLVSGQSEETVLSQILGSAEFFAKSQNLVATGTDQERYVQTLYQVLLKRTASASEIASWLGALNSQGNAAVVKAFLTSAEYRTSQVEAYYTTLLHRPSDAVGRSFWVGSSLNVAQIRIGIDGTSEFFVNG